MDQPSIGNKTKSACIASELEKMILDGVFEVGKYLPSQKEISERFGVSPRSAREAFKYLEARGLVHITQGRRAQVEANNFDQFVCSLSDSLDRSRVNNKKLMLDLLQVQASVMVATAGAFSTNSDKKNILSKLRTYCRGMSEQLPTMRSLTSKAFEKYACCDRNFQKELVQASGNLILNVIHEYLSPLLDERERLLKYTNKELEKHVDNCSRLCDALEEGQVDLVVALLLIETRTLKARIEASFHA